jgi:hypothetical protein
MLLKICIFLSDLMFVLQYSIQSKSESRIFVYYLFSMIIISHFIKHGFNERTWTSIKT